MFVNRCGPWVLFGHLLRLRLVFSVFAVCAGVGLANDLIDNLRLHAPFEHVGEAEGLSNMSVTCMMQDSRGFMWIGTLDGLNVYDGRRCRVFRKDEAVPSTISSNSIWSICEDEAGFIWVGTTDGLNRFDPTTGQFTIYRSEGDPHSLSSNLVRSLLVDSQGRFWVGTDDNGLNLFDRETGRSRHFFVDSMDSDVSSGMGVWTIYEDSTQHIWVGTTDGMLSRFDSESESFEHVGSALPSGWETPPDAILCMLEIAPGRFWYGTFGSGLFELDTETGALIHLPLMTDEGRAIGNFSKGIARDQFGNIWIASHDGLLALDPDGTIQARMVENERNSQSLSSNQLWSIFCDQSGNLWTGSYQHGIDWLSLENLGFKTIRLRDFLDTSPKANKTLCFVEDKDGTVYIGTDGDGLYAMSADRTQFTPLRPAEIEMDSESSSIAILSLHIDRKGILWLGIWSGGLLSYDPKTREFQQYWQREFVPRKFVNNPFIWSILEDSKGALWIGTMGNGLNRRDPATGLFEYFENVPGDPASLSNDNVWCIFEDSQQRLWIGTQDGVNRLNPDGKSFTRYQRRVGDTASLNNDWVKSIAEDQGGNLWFGTDGGGLNRLDEETGTFTHIGEADGLRNGVIQHLELDASGRLWAATNDGISSIEFSSSDGSFRIKNYDSSSGLQGNQFAIGAGLSLSDGKIILGGLNGFSIFDPDEIQPMISRPRVHITGLWKANEIFAKRNALFGQARLEIQGDSITLPYTENDFLIEFVSINYFSTKEVPSKYRLSGFEENWTYAEGESVVRYANLPAGEYVFELMAENGMVEDARDVASLKIEILKPWWQKGWAFLLLGLLLLALFIATHWISVRVLRRQKAKLRSMVDERTERIGKQAAEIEAQNAALSRQNERLIALDAEKNFLVRAVAHDLRDPIARTSSLIDLLVQESKGANLEYVSVINESLDDLMKMIAKILDVSVIEKESIKVEQSHFRVKEAVERSLSLRQASAGAKRITLHTESADPSLEMWGDPELFHQIVENLLSNAIKYSPFDTEVFVRWSRSPESRRIRIEVQDQGPGIRPGEMEKLFQRFQRLSSTPTNREPSVGLGLAIVKKYTEAMGGSVWCESRFGEGCTFIVEFPDTSDGGEPVAGSTSDHA
jgi:signal transduction histidine kinase/ligand-binding sensor domain-containing protein